MCPLSILTLWRHLLHCLAALVKCPKYSFLDHSAFKLEVCLIVHVYILILQFWCIACNESGSDYFGNESFFCGSVP